MPRGDRTGPDGMGSMTGRGAGFCSGSGMPGYQNQYGGRGQGLGRGNRFAGGMGYGHAYGPGPGAGYGRGMGRGFGPGWDRGYAYGPTVSATPEAEKQQLQREAEYVEEELKAIRKHLDDLGAKADA